MRTDDGEIKVSVYVITYNQEAYIRQCLDGIVSQQTDFRFEAIVIDDCSTDGTPAIIADYARQYPDIIRPITPPHNRYSRHESKFLLDFLPNARGKYIAMCEGDDFWTYDGKLQHQADFLDSHPDYTAHTHRHRILNETDLRITATISVCTTPDADTDPAALLMCHYHLNSIMMRASDFKQDSVFLKLRNNQHSLPGDIMLFTHIAERKSYSENAVWSVYRLNQSGVFVSERINYQERSYHILRNRHNEYLRILSNYYPILFNKYGNILKMYDHTSLSSYYFSEGKTITALYHKLSAFLAAPCSFVNLYINKWLKPPSTI